MPITTVADLIQELQTADPALLVFVFDGAEAWPIEVNLTIHRTHAAPHVSIGKAADKEATLARLIRDAVRVETEIAELYGEMEKAGRQVRDLVRQREQLALIRERVEGK
jgi:hypothetical protein